MAKKKKKNRVELIDMSELDKAGMIESTTIDVEQLTLRGKRWRATLKIGTILPRSYHQYDIKLDLDEEPYEKRIEEIRKTLENGLFSGERVSRKQANESIKAIEDEMRQMRRDCERIDFRAVVETIAYKDSETVVVCRVPDDVIEPINRQKFRFEAYKIALIPQS